jgi:hypothetical protein
MAATESELRAQLAHATATLQLQQPACRGVTAPLRALSRWVRGHQNNKQPMPPVISIWPLKKSRSLCAV